MLEEAAGQSSASLGVELSTLCSCVGSSLPLGDTSTVSSEINPELSFRHGSVPSACSPFAERIHL